MSNETFVLGNEGGVGVITLNRPERLNALSSALTLELDRALTGFEEDADVKAIFITGAGDGAFSAEAAIHEIVQRAEVGLAI